MSIDTPLPEAVQAYDIKVAVLVLSIPLAVVIALLVAIVKRLDTLAVLVGAR